MVLLPQFAFVYILVVSVTVSHIMAAILTSLLFVLLMVFRIPPVDKRIAGEVLQSHKVSIIAHRGGGSDAPENTLAAIRTVSSNATPIFFSRHTVKMTFFLKTRNKTKTRGKTKNPMSLPCLWVLVGPSFDKASASDQALSLKEGGVGCLNSAWTWSFSKK